MGTDNSMRHTPVNRRKNKELNEPVNTTYHLDVGILTYTTQTTYHDSIRLQGIIQGYSKITKHYFTKITDALKHF
jgi:hypothetical protein